MASAPSTNDGSKKQRLIPPEQSALVEQTGREIALQYLMQRPENLGELINNLPEDKRYTAVNGIDEKLFLRCKDVIPANGNREIKGSDTIAFIAVDNGNVGTADIAYGVVKFHTLPTHVQGVLEFVFRAWKTRIRTDDAYIRQSEMDGSAAIYIDDNFESISGEIRAYVESLREDHEREQNELRDDEEGEGGEFDEDEVEHAVQEELVDCLLDVERLRTNPDRSRFDRSLYERTPLMTMRCDGA